MALSLEEVARIQASIDGGSDRDSVLRGAGLTPDAWRDAKLGWLDAMANELADGESRMLERYGAAFMAHAPEHATPPKPAVPHARTATPLPMPAAIDAPSLSAAAPSVAALPSYLLQPAAQPAAQQPPPAVVAATSHVDLQAVIRGLNLPFADAPAAGSPPPAAAPPAATATRPRISTATVVAMPMPTAPQEATPFRSAAAAPVPAPAAPSRISKALSGTAHIDLQAAMQGMNLPFNAGQTSKQEAAPAAPPAARSVSRVASGTMISDTPLVAPATPFQAPHAASPQTRSPSQPPPTAAPRPPFDWPVERFAALYVDMTTGPKDAVYRAYGITPADYVALDTYWHRAFADPQIKARFTQACDRYRAERQAPRR